MDDVKSQCTNPRAGVTVFQPLNWRSFPKPSNSCTLLDRLVNPRVLFTPLAVASLVLHSSLNTSLMFTQTTNSHAWLMSVASLGRPISSTDHLQMVSLRPSSNRRLFTRRHLVTGRQFQSTRTLYSTLRPPLFVFSVVLVITMFRVTISPVCAYSHQ